MHTMKRHIATSALVAVALVFGACDLLEVENPNSLEEGNLNDPSSAQAMANGLKGSLARGMSYQLAPYGMATDELTWIGSRDAWQQLDFGNLDDPNNEFSDLAYPFLAEAYWLSGEYIERIEGFRDEGTLPSESILVETYFYGAITYASVADVYDDYVTGSSKREGGTRISETEGISMRSLYDRALTWIENAQALNEEAAEPTLQAELKALEARVRFGRSLWDKLNPLETGEDALVNNSEAKAAAEEALGMLAADGAYELPIEGGSSFDSYVAGQVNGRREMRIGDAYVEGTEEGNTFEEMTFEDPIEEVIHPYVQEIVTTRYPSSGTPTADITVVSAREMHLIIAEHELANSNMGAFDAAINELRAINDLSSYDGPSSDGINRIALLEQSRQANLFFQGRRLKDLYRFQETTPEWVSSASAVESPGTFLPITASEIDQNENVDR
jgi:hypothetical protein